ncbi:hypothetical protein Taro_011206 [Colocasia esculenta]|uniref:Uncharacterized protein n=1 Tax=Colocasia esculenta TaxID=4460 RepID=A0A843U989_COLES|nr:hypothetical protein [Colocasia esculenta]
MDTTTPSSTGLPSQQKGTQHPGSHQVFLHTRREQAQDKNKQENKPLDQVLARQDLKLLALRANNLNKALSQNYTGSLRISIIAQRAKS